jgi:hypothetical protein
MDIAFVLAALLGWLLMVGLVLGLDRLGNQTTGRSSQP